ncbi:methyltransferase domain-containing protein [Pelagibius sp. 7325]|uniref:class I SAM-dependent methyltransferase n=1 Tax=Pelagibius sp. 7325 TaxID=3131994 RepID=UPI0030EE2B1D
MPFDQDKLIDRISARPPTEGWLYFRRFLKHPARLASLTPSSQALSRAVAQQVRRGKDEYVVELGCGTGAITRALLAAGVPPERLIAVDVDAELLAVLREEFADITVLECDAAKLTKHLPPAIVGKVGTVICGIPISLLPRPQQRALIDEMFALMPPGRRFLAYTHRQTSPLPRRELGLAGERLARTLRNLPPASVWGYAPRNKA